MSYEHKKETQDDRLHSREDKIIDNTSDKGNIGKFERRATLSLFKLIIYYTENTGHQPKKTVYSNDYSKERKMFLRGADKISRDCCLLISARLQEYEAIDQFLTHSSPSYSPETQILTFHMKADLMEYTDQLEQRFGYEILELCRPFGVVNIAFSEVEPTNEKYERFGKKPAFSPALKKLQGYTLVSKWWAERKDFLNGKISKIELYDNLNYTIHNKIEEWNSPRTPIAPAPPEPIYNTQPRLLSSFANQI